MNPVPLRFHPSLFAAVLLAGTAELPGASMCFLPVDASAGERLWAFEVGVAFITESTIDDLLLRGDSSLARGAARGEIYSLTASRKLGELKLEIGGCEFHPVVEMPLTLEIIDEDARSPFWDLNASVVIRWTEFPWNDYVRTTLASGVGLSYSDKIYQIDIDRHPGEDRSHLKFNWPIQLSLALPAYPDHQLLLYIAHQSGGHVFDAGGVNSVGFGYRYDF